MSASLRLLYDCTNPTDQISNAYNSPHNPLPPTNHVSDPLLGLHPRLFLPLLHHDSLPISQFTAHNLSQSSFPAAISSNATERTSPGWANTSQTNEDSGVNRAWTKGMGPGASVVSTGWSDQVRFFQLKCRVRSIHQVRFDNLL
jgi:hypothetical protein